MQLIIFCFRKCLREEIGYVYCCPRRTNLYVEPGHIAKETHSLNPSIGISIGWVEILYFPFEKRCERSRLAILDASDHDSPLKMRAIRTRHWRCERSWLAIEDASDHDSLLGCKRSWLAVEMRAIMTRYRSCERSWLAIVAYSQKFHREVSEVIVRRDPVQAPFDFPIRTPFVREKQTPFHFGIAL